MSWDLSWIDWAGRHAPALGAVVAIAGMAGSAIAWLKAQADRRTEREEAKRNADDLQNHIQELNRNLDEIKRRPSLLTVDSLAKYIENLENQASNIREEILKLKDKLALYYKRIEEIADRFGEEKLQEIDDVAEEEIFYKRQIDTLLAKLDQVKFEIDKVKMIAEKLGERDYDAVPDQKDLDIVMQYVRDNMDMYRGRGVGSFLARVAVSDYNAQKLAETREKTAKIENLRAKNQEKLNYIELRADLK